MPGITIEKEDFDRLAAGQTIHLEGRLQGWRLSFDRAVVAELSKPKDVAPKTEAE